MKNNRQMRAFKIFPAILITLLLSACVSSGGYNKEPWKSQRAASAAQAPSNIATTKTNSRSASSQTPVKVAILLPLSGQHKNLGQAMLNAAQMALFDIAYDNFVLIPKDTKATAIGARIAAKAAIQDGAELVLGPIFSASVKAAREVTQSANINMIAFSTDWRLANNKTFLISFLPFDQIERVISYAANAGYRKIGVLSPQGSYGDAVTSAYQTTASNIGLPPSQIERFSQQNELGTVVRRFSKADAPFNAILMPVGGTTARQISSFLNHYDMPAHSVKRLGTGLMDDAALARDKTLDGAWFAAPSPQSRQKFERRYNNIYYTKPPRIASLAYDATALAAILARMGQENDGSPAFDYASITSPSGFNGVDGIFRFRPDGIVERGLAVLEYKRGAIVVIDQAPRTFQRDAF